MNKDQLLILIEKYLDGEATPAEQRWVENWYHTFEQEDEWLPEGSAAAAETREQLKSTLKEKLGGIRQLDAVNHQVFQLRRRHIRIISGVAAAILLLVTTTLLYWWLSAGAGNMVITAVGKPRYIALPDGSTVWLNTGSKLEYAKGFSGRERAVLLEGEAYFDVVENEKQPFLVRSGKLITRVLGTAFSVKAYKNMDTIMVTVLQGKVQVNDEAVTMATLTKRERLLFQTTTGNAARDEVDSLATHAWDSGQLEFEKQTLKEITTILGKWHGYTFVFHHAELEQCIYTGTLDRTAPLAEQVNLLCDVNNMNCRIDSVSKEVWIDGTGCNQ